jgi:hypothetical protein
LLLRHNKSFLRQFRSVEDESLARQILHKDGYRYPLDRPTQDCAVDGCGRIVDVFAEAGVPTLLNREVVPLRGEESCRGVHVTIEEDLMYRYDQEIGKSVKDCMTLQIGIHGDESC